MTPDLVEELVGDDTGIARHVRTSFTLIACMVFLVSGKKAASTADTSAGTEKANSKGVTITLLGLAGNKDAMNGAIIPAILAVMLRVLMEMLARETGLSSAVYRNSKVNTQPVPTFARIQKIRMSLEVDSSDAIAMDTPAIPRLIVTPPLRPRFVFGRIAVIAVPGNSASEMRKLDV